MCAVAAARAGEGVQSCVSGGGCRPVTPGEGGACGAGRRQRGSGQAAAHAAQSPGVERRGLGETYTGPPGPAQRRRRDLRRVPPLPWALAVCPALLQVTLAAGEKLREEGAVWTRAARGGRVEGGSSRLWPQESGRCPELPSQSWPGDPRKARWSPRYCGTRRCAEKGGDPDPQARLRRRPGRA